MEELIPAKASRKTKVSSPVIDSSDDDMPEVPVKSRARSRQLDVPDTIIEAPVSISKIAKPEKRVYIKITTLVTSSGSEHTMELSTEKLKADKTKGEQVFRKTVIGNWDVSMPTEEIMCLFSYKNNVIQSVMAFYDRTKAVNKFFKELARLHKSLSDPEMGEFDGLIESYITKDNYMATLLNSEQELDPIHSITWKLM